MKNNMKLVLVIFLPLLIFYFPDFAIASSRLKVNCDLEGAEVFLDEKFKGECPVEFGVSAGKHKVVVRKDLDNGSYYYYERETRVGEDVIQEINAKLKRIYTEQYYWNQAEKHRTIESYKVYLMKYPGGKFAKDAKLKIEQYFWNQAEKHRTIESYKVYLMKYPGGKFAKDAKVKIEEQIEKLKMKLEEKLPLRSKPLEVLKAQAQKVFGLDKNWQPREYIPREYIENNFENLGNVVIDHVTGLMWQRLGSYEKVRRKNVQAHIDTINGGRFAGYNDWRLPTIPELMSLLEREEQSNGLYINPIFGPTQWKCWSADKDPSVRTVRDTLIAREWVVYFGSGTVGRVGDALGSGYGGGYYYVRAVRSLLKTEQDYWNRAEEQGELEYYKEYLRNYPGGKFAKDAKVKIEEQTEKLKMKLEEKLPLRSKPLEVLKAQAQKVFGLDKKQRPLKYIENAFEDQGDVVVDHATGLMWQKSGSDMSMVYEDAQTYIDKLNRERFAGYNDWRLPTIPELMSLLEPRKSSNRLYIDSIFNERQRWYWSADKGSSRSAWLVYFGDGNVRWRRLDYSNYVRAVRSLALSPGKELIVTPTPIPKGQIQLRSEPLTVSGEEAPQAFNINGAPGRPLKYIENDFEERGDVVIDHTTGLMWQKSGSDKVSYRGAQAYIEKLNREQFAGYDDWRLPTIPELISLLEPKRQSNDVYINPIFDVAQIVCWSADRISSGSACVVYFYGGCVHWRLVKDNLDVRAVRSLLGAINALAIDYPPLKARVNDYAGVLKEDQWQDLETILQDFNTKNPEQIFVAIMERIPSGSLEGYVNDLFAQWQPGQKGQDNGVLLAIFIKDRKLRIEIGYGIERTLTSAACKLIIENDIVPRFKEGDFYGGIKQGLKSMILTLHKNYTLTSAPDQTMTGPMPDFKLVIW